MTPDTRTGTEQGANFTPSSPGKAELAYDWIAAEIRARRFAPGHRLVLTQLAEAIGVSVAPVREALRLLEAEGLVVNQRNVGSHVAMIDERGYAEVMYTLAVLEGAAVGLAAPTLSPADLAEAHRINADLAEVTSSLESFEPRRFTTLNRAFHETLSQRCSNHYLCDQITAAWTRLDSLRESSFSFIPRRAAASVREHDQILAAIERGDDPGTIELLTRHHRLATLDSFTGRASEPQSPLTPPVPAADSPEDEQA